MKNHRFLWLRNRTTNNRKCEKARNIKEKRTIEMFSTASRLPAALRSSASADSFPKPSRIPETARFRVFSFAWGRRPAAESDLRGGRTQMKEAVR